MENGGNMGDKRRRIGGISTIIQGRLGRWDLMMVD